MEDGRPEHACPGCNHSVRSVEALQARLADLDRRGDGSEASFEAWTQYFEEVCGLVADVTCLDLDAVTTILEGLMVLDGAARAKGADAVRDEWQPSPPTRLGRCDHGSPGDRRRRRAVIMVAGSG